MDETEKIGDNNHVKTAEQTNDESPVIKWTNHFLQNNNKNKQINE